MAVETITTVLQAATATAPAKPYDLTDLTAVKSELSLTSNDTSWDAFLSRAISQSSAVIARFCNRVFSIEAIQDVLYIQQDPYPWQVPGGVYPLQLSRWPLYPLTPAVISITGDTHGNQTVDNIASTTGIQVGTLLFAADGSVPAGTTITAVGANSLTLSQAAGSSESALSMNTGVQVQQLLSVGTIQTLVYGQDYTVDAVKGWLIRLDAWTGVSVRWEAVPTTVQYTAGYAGTPQNDYASAPDSMPDDLQEACLRLVTARYKAKGRDPMMVERNQQGPTLGSERFWVGSLPGQEGSLPPEVEAMVDQYRVPVV